MPRDPDLLSRMEILVLSSLARQPMHGYEVKLELRYKHVKWWAKCEHGHLYAALGRLERGGFIRRAVGGSDDRRAPKRRVYRITPSGRRRLRKGLELLGESRDSTYFDVDLFLSGAFALDRRRALRLLAQRREVLRRQFAEARALQQSVGPFVPAVGRLIMEHRVSHLARELEFAGRAARVLRAQASWGPFLGSRRIGDFVEETAVHLEPDEASARPPAGGAARRRPARLRRPRPRR